MLWAGKATVVAAVGLRGQGPAGGEGPGHGATGGAGGCVVPKDRRPAASRALLQGQRGIAQSSDGHLLSGITDVWDQRQTERQRERDRQRVGKGGEEKEKKKKREKGRFISEV